MNTATLPCSYFHRGHPENHGEHIQLISSLRQHSQHMHSPAYGYQARNASVVDLWPDVNVTTSREARLADEISRNRMLRHGTGTGKGKAARRRQRNTGHESDEMDRKDQQAPQHRRRRSKSAARPSSRVEALESEDTVHHSSIFKVMRGLRHRDAGGKNRRWSLEPGLREERRPVSIQPVKEQVMKRWRRFRSRSRRDNLTSASAEGSEQRHLVSDIPRDSLQLNRSKSIQIMTMIQESGCSLMPTPIPHVEASLNLAPTPVSPAMTDHSHESRKLNHPTPLILNEPLSSTHMCFANSPTNHEDVEKTSYFALTDKKPGESSQRPDSSWRIRTSTSGTRIFTPPLFAEASRNTREFENNGSSSSGISPQQPRHTCSR